LEAEGGVGVPEGSLSSVGDITKGILKGEKGLWNDQARVKQNGGKKFILRTRGIPHKHVGCLERGLTGIKCLD